MIFHFWVRSILRKWLAYLDHEDFFTQKNEKSDSISSRQWHLKAAAQKERNQILGYHGDTLKIFLAKNYRHYEESKN